MVMKSMSMRNPHRILVVKREGKRLLVRPRRRWENNIRVDLTEVGWEDVDWLSIWTSGGIL
jgi:hypothetical protein